MEKKEMSSAEKTLSTMATVVLVLGVIGSIATFFSSCVTWETKYDGLSMDGINWLGFPILIYIVMATLIGWSLLSVIAEISVNIRQQKGGKNDDWKKDFAVLIATEQITMAKTLLYSIILESPQFKKVLEGGREEYHSACLKELHNMYGLYLKALGEDQFKFDKTNELFNAFK